MKKLVGITLIVLLISFSSNAQQNNKQQRKGSDFTAEQKATLGTKKMALTLDLSDAQQKQVYNLMKENMAEREKQQAAMKAQKENDEEITNEQKFKMQYDRLEKQIEHKAAMKTILSKDQYEKWSAMMDKKMMNGKKRMSQNGKSTQNRGPKNRSNKS